MSASSTDTTTKVEGPSCGYIEGNIDKQPVMVILYGLPGNLKYAHGHALPRLVLPYLFLFLFLRSQGLENLSFALICSKKRSKTLPLDGFCLSGRAWVT
jgi:hypothetical protein